MGGGVEDLTLPDTLEAVVTAASSSENAGDQPGEGAGEKKPDSGDDTAGGVDNPDGDDAEDGDSTGGAENPDGYETAVGVELPRITVTVVEEPLQEEKIAPSYASMPADEVAPVAQQDGTGKIELVSADNAGDRHRVRILWQTVKTVSKNATSIGCEKSWAAFRVPGMSGEMKFHFTKEMLTDSSKVYTLTEFTLPYTYEDEEDIFPNKLGIYSALSLFSGQFMGRVTLQAYDYIAGEWMTYSNYEIAPETAGGGGLIADAYWIDISQPVVRTHYVDIDRQDLYMSGTGRVEKRWDLVFMDSFGVVVTEKSKGWSDSWELQREDKTPYPAEYQISLSDGSLTGFKLTAASGVNGIPQGNDPWVLVITRGPKGGTGTLQIKVSLNTVRYIMQYWDSKDMIYSETVTAGSAYQVADMTKVELNQGRDIVVPKGHEFADAYDGSDGKTYRVGDSIPARVRSAVSAGSYLKILLPREKTRKALYYPSMERSFRRRRRKSAATAMSWWGGSVRTGRRSIRMTPRCRCRIRIYMHTGSRRRLRSRWTPTAEALAAGSRPGRYRYILIRSLGRSRTCRLPLHARTMISWDGDTRKTRSLRMR